MIENCIAHYKMNDNLPSTNVIESISGNNGMSAKNTNLMHTTGKIGGALEFNGISDYVDTEQTFESIFQDSFSINLWYKCPQISEDNCFIGSFYLYEEYFSMIFLGTDSTGVFRCSYRSDGFLGGNTTIIAPINEWSMPTMTVEKLTPSTVRLKLYLNGNLVYQISDNANMGNFLSNTNLALGIFNYTQISDYFSGLLDNIMIFNKALNSEEIALLYNSGRGTEDFQLSDNLNSTGEQLFSYTGV